MDRKEISRRILDLTLEIISLLSGEDYTIVKTLGRTPIIHVHRSGRWNRATNTEPPPLIHEEKVLELTHKMMELLTGEVPIKCQDVAVYFSMEEWEYLEGQEDLYDESMMEEQQPLTSPDGLIEGNPPERCPRPLYSQDCPEEKLPENPQMTNQGEDVTDIKVEDEEERMIGNPPCRSEVEEDIPGDVTTGNPSKNSEENIMLSLNYKEEDEDTMQRSSGENCITCNVHPGPHSTESDPSNNPPNHKEPSSDRSQIGTTSNGQKGGKRFQSGEYGKQFTKSIEFRKPRSTWLNKSGINGMEY
ncbi:oocyte zinc finger protein XlCOF7.1-like [Bufo bufo]|uniref:oocyte zinc finger protein XlCOF7.1-like n=1 Tax=Bufo bufo TaxID=8384 RepID=UPI001ABE08CD|nr:oocyte zinc finger protein XlCOF7.1-like [Bufo bufo]